MLAIVMLLGAVVYLGVIWFVAATLYLSTRPSQPWNWRAFSPYHFFDDGPNGYFAWLDEQDPDWWKNG